MQRFTLTLAEVPISATVQFPSTREYCAEWETPEATPVEHVTISEQDIAAEREPHTPPSQAEAFSSSYLETLALYRAIAQCMADHDAILFHGSVIEVDGKVYIFTAPSGTGKSTHARLWRELLGSQARMINDDKPLLRFNTGAAGTIQAYGTPWRGKHMLGTNIHAPVKGICVLHQAPKNTMTRLSSAQSLPLLLQQTFRPKEADSLEKTLAMIMRMAAELPVWSMGCTPTLDAAALSYTTMSGDRSFV